MKLISKNHQTGKADSITLSTKKQWEDRSELPISISYVSNSHSELSNVK